MDVDTGMVIVAATKQQPTTPSEEPEDSPHGVSPRVEGQTHHKPDHQPDVDEARHLGPGLRLVDTDKTPDQKEKKDRCDLKDVHGLPSLHGLGNV